MRSFGSATKYLLALLGFGMVAATLLLYQELTNKASLSLWNGLKNVYAADAKAKPPYDLKQLKVANEVLKRVQKKYVDPARVKPKDMLLSALDFVQKNVAQISVVHDEGAPDIKVRVDEKERVFAIEDVFGLWDVAAKLREIFVFIQDGLVGTEVDLREVEYAACNGMLHTLDPHSVLLSPEAYKEMNVSTSGHFGGLGIVIAIRDQKLTVINPMPNTPAGRAGLKRFDRIEKIDGESTLNMGVTEAVNHLRGEPDTKVTIWVHRDGVDGWPGVRPYELVRQIIKVQSVDSKLLEGNIGYIRLRQFAQTTSNDIDAALFQMKKNGELKGLVLDLRGNPGGLLDQAARIADKFISSGPIVATVGSPGEGRDEKKAVLDGTEPDYPLVVLISGSSASASEIVAGALKNHNRAVLVGQTTFGKGSVQLIFNDLPDKAALKLTIAQYLTEPGDVSIQGTGVTPDIELDPMTADAQEMDLSVDSGGIHEKDLSRSLSSARNKDAQKPNETIRYYLPQKERQDLRERGGEPDDVFVLDFPMRFARELASKLPRTKRLDVLRAAKDYLESVKQAELAKVSAELATMGIDWSAPPPNEKLVAGAKADVEVNISSDKPHNEVLAGESMLLKVSVTNKGSSTFYRLSAVTKSDNIFFGNKELIIGKLSPGQTKEVQVPLGFCDVEGHKFGSTAQLPKDAPTLCKIPKDLPSRADWVSLKFDEARGFAFPESRTQIAVKALPRPIFAYSYQLVDSGHGNGDGLAQLGESFSLFLTVKNAGSGQSYETQANLRNLSGDGILLHEGRFDLSNMAPGETRKVVFTFDISHKVNDGEAKVELIVSDQDLRESISEKIRMPLSAALVMKPTSGKKYVKNDGVFVYESADVSARVVGKLRKESTVTELATTQEFTKILLEANRFAFIKTSELGEGVRSPLAFPLVEDVMTHMPPHIEIAAVPLATTDSKISISAILKDESRLLDAYLFVGTKKVFYQSNRAGKDLKKMEISTDLPLKPGVNIISFFARENPDTIGRKLLVVRRDGPKGEPLSTSKNDDELSENMMDD